MSNEQEYINLVEDYNKVKKELATLNIWKANFLQMIKDSLLDCQDAIKDYELSEEGADLINLGWIEAHEFILDASTLLKVCPSCQSINWDTQEHSDLKECQYCGQAFQIPQLKEG